MYPSQYGSRDEGHMVGRGVQMKCPDQQKKDAVAVLETPD